MRKRAVAFSLMVFGVGALGFANWKFHEYGFNLSMPSSEYFPNWDTAKVESVPPLRPYTPDSPSVATLKNEFGLKDLASKDFKNRYALLQAVLKWSSTRWQYDGDNDPETSNPLVILEKARKGQKYRCVEFAEVTVAAARAVGFQARVLKLRTKDVETAEVGAGHVVAEVWLEDIKKWAFVDAQFGVIPEMRGVPLSVTEFIEALKAREDISYFSTGKTRMVGWSYPRWVAPYLYFVQYDLDQRFDHDDRGIDRVVLTSKGIPAPRFFQRRALSGKSFQISNAALFDAAPISSLF